jgi:hypothetical protein
VAPSRYVAFGAGGQRERKRGDGEKLEASPAQGVPYRQHQPQNALPSANTSILA